MATFGAGTWAYGSGANYWLQLQIDDPPASIDAGTMSVTLTARLVLYTDRALVDSVNANSLSGSLGSGTWSAAVSHGSSGGGTQVASVTASVATVEGSPVVVTVNGSISGYEALGVQSVSGQVVIPARPSAVTVPGKPGAPTLLSRTATRIDVQWAAPSDNGGAAVSGYDLRWSTGTPSGAGTAVGGTSYAIQSLSPNTTYQVQARAKNSAGAGDWGPVATHTTLPNVPAAPTSVSAARVSDTQHTVTWAATSTSPAPITAQRVQRLLVGTSSWMTIATVGGAVRSYSDTTTVANRAYQWRIVAENVAGTSVSAASAVRYTTPSAPSVASATRSGSNIVVTWSQEGVGFSASTEVWESAGGGAWALLATVAHGTTSWTHVGPSEALTHQYRVRHRTTVAPTLYSGYSTTSTIQLPAQPNAPTGLGPTAVRDATEAVLWTWAHNPVDGSGQTYFELRHRPEGYPVWTTVGPVLSSVSGWVLPGGTYPNPVAVEWQVRTRGQHATYSPWSATAVSPTSTRPTATIAAIGAGGVLGTSRLTVSWAYFDAEATAQAAWEVALFDDALSLVETRTGVGSATTTTLTAVLPDATSWVVAVRVRDSDGLWSAQDEAPFTVSYPLPPAPVLTSAWDPAAGTVTLDIDTPPPGAGQAAAVALDVHRAIGDGPFVLIAQDAPPTVTITDFSPPLAGAITYRATTRSALDAAHIGPEVGVMPTGAAAVMISTGPGFSQVCRAGLRVRLSVSTERERIRRRYAGRTRAVTHTGELVTKTLTLSTTTAPDLAGYGSTWQEWEDLATADGPFLWRDPEGRYLPVTPVGGVQVVRAEGGVVHEISVKFEVVDGA